MKNHPEDYDYEPPHFHLIYLARTLAHYSYQWQQTTIGISVATPSILSFANGKIPHPNWSSASSK
jgi:primosomal protein N'